MRTYMLPATTPERLKDLQEQYAYFEYGVRREGSYFVVFPFKRKKKEDRAQKQPGRDKNKHKHKDKLEE